MPITYKSEEHEIRMKNIEQRNEVINKTADEIICIILQRNFSVSEVKTLAERLRYKAEELPIKERG